MKTNSDDFSSAENLHKVEEESLFTAEYCISHGALEDLRTTAEYKSATPTLQIVMELEAAQIRLNHEIETYNEHIKAYRNDKAQEQLQIIKLVRAGISALHEKRTKYNVQRQDEVKNKR